MEIFETPKKFLKVLGIYQAKHSEKLKIILLNIICILLLLSFLFSGLWFIFFGEKSFIELVKCICVVMIGFLNCFTYTTILSQKSVIFRLFDEINQVIQKRKF